MAKIRRGFGYRSGFEDKVQKALKEKGVAYEYENKNDIIRYTIPSSLHKYTVDFSFIREDGSKWYCEAKGRFDPEDRKKMLLIKEQHPELDIRLLFMRDQPIRKGSKTMYSDWAKKSNYIYAVGIQMPEEWFI